MVVQTLVARPWFNSDSWLLSLIVAQAAWPCFVLLYHSSLVNGTRGTITRYWLSFAMVVWLASNWFSFAIVLTVTIGL